MRRFASACAEMRRPRIPRRPDAEERDLLWKGRKNAFGAVGRVARPITSRTAWCRARRSRPRSSIAESQPSTDLVISNIFHAGDGNMHPIILFDPHIPGELEKAKAAGEEILEWCISVGGSITGEHGVGMEKNEMMAHLFSADSLDMIGASRNSSIPNAA